METRRPTREPYPIRASARRLSLLRWTRSNPGSSLVDTGGAVVILGVTPQYVGRLAAQGRLPWLPTGRSSPVYRRVAVEVIAQGRGRAGLLGARSGGRRFAASAQPRVIRVLDPHY
jgi:hypothetical protein